MQHGEGIVWYEGLGFDIGTRVTITGSEAQSVAGAKAGSVVGFEASGPRPGETFIRVLIQPDTLAAQIVALPPASLAPEPGSEREGLARSILSGLAQNLPPPHYNALLTWLAGEAGQALAADPQIRRQRVRVAGMSLPGLVFPELVTLAQSQV